MEIRDPVHGSIHILDEEIPIIRDDFFQRLRNIKQLGFSEYVFPGATHTRFIHSIGVMNVAEKAFDRLFKEELADKNFQRLKETFKLACLLHDVGHGLMGISLPRLQRCTDGQNRSQNSSQRISLDHGATDRVPGFKRM